MLFNSIPFLIFIGLFFGIWPLVNKNNTSKWIWICLMSFLFYGWWDWRFLFLLIFTGSVDYYAGRLIIKSPDNKKFWLWFSLLTNILCLFIFKYSGWLASLLDDFCSVLNIRSSFRTAVPPFTLVLPVGISFYTFNSMSYTIDLYRGKTKPAKNILHFFAFISFFPHLVAGPIIRARDILQQLSQPVNTASIEIFNGIRTCVWGFFQKMVLADNIAVMVNEQFNHIEDHTDSTQWWICILAFAFQIYFDFNGYSSIARGVAKLCGIHFRLNFNHPYFASSFQNFWQRWHISLSNFFRDYVYISLGGNRRGKFRNLFNLWITMLLSGLWHGANLTFLIWGALHAAYLTVERLFSRFNWNIKSKLIKIPLHFIFIFLPILLAWVFFRAENLQDAIYILHSLFKFNSNMSITELFLSNAVFWLVIGIINEYILFHKFNYLFKRNLVFQAILTSITIAIIVFFRGPEQQFIYFQF